MIQRSCCPGFLLEPAEAIAVRIEVAAQQLDGNIAAEPRVRRAITQSTSPWGFPSLILASAHEVDSVAQPSGRTPGDPARTKGIATDAIAVTGANASASSGLGREVVDLIFAEGFLRRTWD